MESQKMYQIKEVRAALTYRCNLSCAHCYALSNKVGEGERLEQLYDTPDGPFASLLSRARKEHGTNRLSITGGEVLMPTCIATTLDLTRHACGLGMTVRVVTNGTLLTDHLLKDLVAAAGSIANLVFQISLDSCHPEIHDAFRGKAGALSDTVQGIHVALQHGCQVNVRYTIRHSFVQDAVETYEFVSRLGVDAFVIKPVFRTGRAMKKEDLVPSPRCIRETQLRLAEASRKRATLIKMAQPVYIQANELASDMHVEIAKCNCGRDGVTVNQEGDVYPCNFILGLPESPDWVLGNLLDPHFDLLQVWNSTRLFDLYRDRTVFNVTCPSYYVMMNGRIGLDD